MTNITATLDVGGLRTECNCPRTATETAGVAPRPVIQEVDTFGKLPNDEVKARVQNFYTQLANNPTSQGYIVIYGPAGKGESGLPTVGYFKKGTKLERQLKAADEKAKYKIRGVARKSDKFNRGIIVIDAIEKSE